MQRFPKHYHTLVFDNQRIMYSQQSDALFKPWGLYRSAHPKIRYDISTIGVYTAPPSPKSLATFQT